MSQPKDWQARFIAAPFRKPGDVGAPAQYFRTGFEAGAGLRQATLHVTALGLVEAHLNGAPVGDEVLVPGWTAYAHRLAVSSHDVTALVQPGRNALGAIAGEGWAVGRVGWDTNRDLWSDRPLVFLQLDLDYGDRVEVVATDGSWLTATGGVLANSIYDGEEYDARLEPQGWNREGFDASAWVVAEVVERDLAALIPQPAPPIRRTEELPVREVIATPAGKRVLDFGQNFSGWVRLRVDAPAGTRISLRHSEVMLAGEADFETNRTAKALDAYTCRGGGEEVWEPRFTFHGFRYVEVDGWPGEPPADAFTGVAINSDMERTGWFECSSELVNQLHRNAVWSMRGNFVGVPTDCPQRDERLGWTGDINAFAPSAAFLYDVRGVLGSWLQDLMAEQLAAGFVSFVVPDPFRRPAPPTALWGDVAVSLPWLLYQEYGDLDVLERQYPSMTRFIDSVEPLLDQRGLWEGGFQFGDWLDPDAPPKSPGQAKTRPGVVASAFLCKTTAELAAAAQLLGKADDAARYAALHDRVRTAFRREWVTEAGLLVNETATAYSLAICFGIVDGDQAARAGERLAALVADAGYRISTGFAGTPYVPHALSRTGQLETAYRLLLQTECPSFLYPVTMGATTIWERWDAVKPDGTLNSTGMTSLNHYALGAVVDWLHKVVGGLDRAEPGYRRLRIAPRPGPGLEHARVVKRLPQGEARVAWRRTETGISLEAAVPAGLTAEVLLPLHPDGRVEEAGPGEHRWDYDVPAPPPRVMTLDSTMRELQAEPSTWEAVRRVLAGRFGEETVDRQARMWPDSSLRVLLEAAPADAPGLEEELDRVLAGEAAAV